jgi:3-oxoadipate enol-lactonase
VVATSEVHHRFDGPADAPALVLSNSLGSTLAMWDPQVPALASRFRVLRYDHRGHGGSPVPPGPYTLAELGGDVRALLDRYELARVSFCGVSLGGLVGMWLASHAPDRVDRLVLCCTAPRFAPARAWAERAALVRAEGTGAVAEAVVGRWFTPSFAARAPDLVARMRAMVASTPAEGYAACCDAIERGDLRPELAAIKAPTLVIAGADDPAAPPEQAYAIAEEVAGARVVVVPHAAHLANVEQADAVTKLILDHLDAHA